MHQPAGFRQRWIPNAREISVFAAPLGLHEVSALAVGGTAKIRTGDTADWPAPMS